MTRKVDTVRKQIRRSIRAARDSASPVNTARLTSSTFGAPCKHLLCSCFLVSSSQQQSKVICFVSCSKLAALSHHRESIPGCASIAGDQPIRWRQLTRPRTCSEIGNAQRPTVQLRRAPVSVFFCAWHLSTLLCLLLLCACEWRHLSLNNLSGPW